MPGRAVSREHSHHSSRPNGPAILQISSYWRPGPSVRINLLPDHEALRLLQLQESKELTLANFLGQFRPRRFALAWCALNFPSQPLKRYTPRDLAAIAQSSITGTSFQMGLKATKKRKLRLAESRLTNSHHKRWQSRVSWVFISLARLSTSQAISAAIIFSGPGPRATRPDRVFSQEAGAGGRRQEQEAGAGADGRSRREKTEGSVVFCFLPSAPAVCPCPCLLPSALSDSVHTQAKLVVDCIQLRPSI